MFRKLKYKKNLSKIIIGVFIFLFSYFYVNIFVNAKACSEYNMTYCGDSADSNGFACEWNDKPTYQLSPICEKTNKCYNSGYVVSGGKCVPSSDSNNSNNSRKQYY